MLNKNKAGSLLVEAGVFFSMIGLFFIFLLKLSYIEFSVIKLTQLKFLGGQFLAMTELSEIEIEKHLESIVHQDPLLSAQKARFFCERYRGISSWMFFNLAAFGVDSEIGVGLDKVKTKHVIYRSR